MFEIRWHGRGGQGCFTVARLLGMAASVHEGKYSLAFPSFGPERRGAPVLGFTRISVTPITDRSMVDQCDYVVILDETLVGPSSLAGIRDGGVLVINTKVPESYVPMTNRLIVGIDATSIAMDVLGRPITNTANAGCPCSSLRGGVAVIGPEGPEAEHGPVDGGKELHTGGEGLRTQEGGSLPWKDHW